MQPATNDVTGLKPGLHWNAFENDANVRTKARQTAFGCATNIQRKAEC